MTLMLRLLSLALFAACLLPAADFQGVIADSNCAQDMVQKGRAETLKRNRSCSLMKDFKRSTYALITGDKKYYRLDDNGNNLARVLMPQRGTR